MIAVDSAFHEYGLQYGDADETVGRVLKKLVRAAFALKACLDVDDAHILFATPKMPEPVWQSARRHLAILEMHLAELSVLGPRRRRLRLIANTDFVDDILTPVLDKIDLVADTAELFMRAQQWCNCAKRHHDPANLAPIAILQLQARGTIIRRSRSRNLASASTFAELWRPWPRRAA